MKTIKANPHSLTGEIIILIRDLMKSPKPIDQFHAGTLMKGLGMKIHFFIEKDKFKFFKGKEQGEGRSLNPFVKITIE